MHSKVLAIIIKPTVNEEDVRAAFGADVKIIHSTERLARDIRIIQQSLNNELYITS